MKIIGKTQAVVQDSSYIINKDLEGAINYVQTLQNEELGKFIQRELCDGEIHIIQISKNQEHDPIQNSIVINQKVVEYSLEDLLDMRSNDKKVFPKPLLEKEKPEKFPGWCKDCYQEGMSKVGLYICEKCHMMKLKDDSLEPSLYYKEK